MTESIKIQPIDPKDGQAVVEFFKIDFLKVYKNNHTRRSKLRVLIYINNCLLQNEPMCKALGGVDSAAFELWLMRTATNGLSFEAIDTSDGNRRVGAYLCTTYKKGEQNPIDAELEAFPGIDDKMTKIAGMLDGMHLNLRPVIYDRYCVDEYLEGVNLSVLPGYAGKGIAGRLTQAIEDKAREMGLSLVYVCCSSEYTARVVEKREYELLHTLPYADYIVDGQIVFVPDAPHTALKCYTKRILPK